MDKKKCCWGGKWTELKLDTFVSYVKAYLTIMNVYRDKYHWKLIYFDGFAGSGSRTLQDHNDELEKSVGLFGEDVVEPNDLQVYQGAAERVVKLEDQMRGFDFYYFIDLKDENCTRLELKLAQYPTLGIKQVRPGDANEKLALLSNALIRNKHFKALVLLDPFGMSISWNSIEKIAGKSVDLWILLPSGVIINRLLERDGSLKHYEKLESFFGMKKDAIRDWFYDEHIDVDLFGETKHWYEKREGAIQRIADLYIELLGGLFPYVTNKPLVMTNSNNVPIYHFVCASFNETAIRIAQDIIRKRQ